MNLSNMKIGQSLVTATGEMSKRDIEKGGEYYEARLHLEKLCKDAGLKCTVHPFDVYQGPFALLPNGAKVWFGDEMAGENYAYAPKGARATKFHNSEELKDLYQQGLKEYEKNLHK